MVHNSALSYFIYLSGLIEIMPDPIIITNRQDDIILVNAQMERLFDYQRSLLIGKKLEILIPERFHTLYLEQREKFFANPTIWHIRAADKFFGLKHDGTELPISISLSPLNLADETLALAVIHDMTIHNVQQIALSDVIEAVQDGLIMVNKQGIIKLVNHSMETIFGYQRHELLGKPIEFLVPDRFAVQHVEYRKKYFKLPHIRAMGSGLNLYAKHKTGQEFPVEISLSPIKSGEDYVVIATIRDMTVYKRNQEAQSRLAAIVEYSDDAIISKDLQGHITSWNKGAENLYGYTAAEVLGKDSAFLYPPDHQQDFLDALHSIEEGKSSQFFETERIHKSGTRIQTSIMYSPIKIQ